MNDQGVTYKADYVRFEFGSTQIDFNTNEVLGEVDYVPGTTNQTFTSESGKVYSIGIPQTESFSFTINFEDYKTRQKYQQIKQRIEEGEGCSFTMRYFVVPFTAFPIDKANEGSDMQLIQATLNPCTVEFPQDYAFDRIARGEGALVHNETRIRVFKSADLPLPNICSTINSSDFAFGAWTIGLNNHPTSVTGFSPATNGKVSAITGYQDSYIIDGADGSIIAVTYDSANDIFNAASSSLEKTERPYTFVTTVSVTLTTGQTCSHDLRYNYFPGEDTTVDDPVNYFTAAIQQDCSLRLTNLILDGAITDIQYQIYSGVLLIDTINTTSTNFDWVAARLYDGETLTITQTVTGTSTTVSTQDVSISVSADCYIEFQSNLASSGTFSPSVASSGDSAIWRLPNKSYQTANSLSVSGSSVGFDGTSQTVRLSYETSWDDLSDFNFSSQSITGALDLSNATEIGPVFLANSNPDLTSIVNPTTSTPFTSYYCDSCNITGVLDMSTVVLGGRFYAHTNPLMTGITHAASSETFIEYLAYSSGLTGTLDVSGLSGLGGVFNVSLNSNLTGISSPTSSVIFTQYSVQNCNLTGTHDISGLSGLGGTINLQRNSSLETILHPTSSQEIALYYAFNCDLTSLDFSTLSMLGGNVRCYGNSRLTSVSVPTNSNTFTHFRFYDCNITGVLDLSGLNGISGVVEVQNNPLMTGISFTSLGVGTVTELTADSCDLGYVDITNLTFSSNASISFAGNSMTVSEVNQILVNIDTVLPSSGTGTISIGGDNAAPDTTSGGFDGVAAAASLSSEGYTVTTS